MSEISIHQPSEKPAPERAIRILMANLPAMLCELLHKAFDAVPDLEVVEPVNDVPQMLSATKGVSIDVILLGSLKTEKLRDAVELLDSLPHCYKSASTVILTQDTDYTEVISLFRAGARGIFGSADLRFDLLCKCIRCVHQGQIWASNELLSHLVMSLSRPKFTDVTDRQGRSLLTAREQQVLHLLAEGLSNHELANALKVSEHTVKNHLFHIYDKLGVSNRMEAVLYALAPRNKIPSKSHSMDSETSAAKVRRAKVGKSPA
jgi:DNA-binding NarL/FixJ family response regulator